MQHKKLLPMCLNSFVTHEYESYTPMFAAPDFLCQAFPALLGGAHGSEKKGCG